jgi:hypothetical protein
MCILLDRPQKCTLLRMCTSTHKCVHLSTNVCINGPMYTYCAHIVWVPLWNITECAHFQTIGDVQLIAHHWQLIGNIAQCNTWHYVHIIALIVHMGHILYTPTWLNVHNLCTFGAHISTMCTKHVHIVFNYVHIRNRVCTTCAPCVHFPIKCALN